MISLNGNKDSSLKVFFIIIGVKVLLTLLLVCCFTESDLLARSVLKKSDKTEEKKERITEPSTTVKKPIKKKIDAKDAKRKKKPAIKTDFKEKNDKKTIKKTEHKKEEGETEKNENEDEKKKAEWIEKTIAYGLHKDRKRAINYILTIKNEDIKKRLIEKLISIIKDEIDIGVKVKAITVAGELKLKNASQALQNSLEDESEDVKISAVYAIKRIGDDSTKPTLIKQLKEQDLEVNSTFTEALIDTLGEFKAIELKEFALESIANDKTSRNIRELFVLFLGRIGSKESKNSLVSILKNDEEEKEIRALAANSLARLGITEAAKDIDDVIQQIESYSFKKKKRYYKLYIYCIAALAKLGDEKAIPRLVNSLRSNNATVRLRAIKLIKELNDERTIDILKYKMNHDPSIKVQKTAKKALIELGIDVDKETPENKQKGKKTEISKKGKVDLKENIKKNIKEEKFLKDKIIDTEKK